MELILDRDYNYQNAGTVQIAPFPGLCGLSVNGQVPGAANEFFIKQFDLNNDDIGTWLDVLSDHIGGGDGDVSGTAMATLIRLDDTSIFEMGTITNVIYTVTAEPYYQIDWITRASCNPATFTTGKNVMFSFVLNGFDGSGIDISGEAHQVAYFNSTNELYGTPLAEVSHPNNQILFGGDGAAFDQANPIISFLADGSGGLFREGSSSIFAPLPAPFPGVGIGPSISVDGFKILTIGSAGFTPNFQFGQWKGDQVNVER